MSGSLNTMTAVTLPTLLPPVPLLPARCPRPKDTPPEPEPDGDPPAILRQWWSAINSLDADARYMMAHFALKMEAALTAHGGNGAGQGADFAGEKLSTSPRNISQPVQRPVEIVCARPGCQTIRKVDKQGALPKWCKSCAKIVKREQDAKRRAKESEGRAKAPKRGATVETFI